MTDRLGDLWATWTEDVLTGGPLAALLAVTLLVWLVSMILAGRTATARHRSAFWWGLVVSLLPLGVCAFGLLWPEAFPWLALGAAVLAVLAALLVRWLVERSVTTCTNGHELAASWVYCPRCPPPAASPSRVQVGGPVMSPAGAVAGAFASGGMSVGSPGFPGVAMSGARPARAPIQPSEAMVRLIAESGGVSDELVGSQGALLGRNPAADIVVDDQAASWEHARIIRRDGSPAVVDLGSSNGTFVNGERVETSLLISGDRLQVGDTIFRVVT